jgi:hypothetical protein
MFAAADPAVHAHPDQGHGIELAPAHLDPGFDLLARSRAHDGDAPHSLLPHSKASRSAQEILTRFALIVKNSHRFHSFSTGSAIRAKPTNPRYFWHFLMANPQSSQYGWSLSNLCYPLPIEAL